AHLLDKATHQGSASDFLASAVDSLLSAASANYVAVVQPGPSGWTVVSAAGDRQPLPVTLLSEALDRERLASSGSWVASPLRSKATDGEVLVLQSTSAGALSQAKEATEALVPVLAHCLTVARRHETEQSRARRLEAILEISNRWNQTDTL